MRKLILGIVAVVCVQIMFQILTAVERLDADTRAKADNAAVVAPITDGHAIDVAKVPTESELPQLDREAVRPPAVTASFKRAATASVGPRPAFSKRTFSRKIDPAVMVAMADRPAPPEILTPQFSAQTARLVTTEAPRREKRSVFAKAFPVIKKPYDWLRSVGSKLN